MSGSVFTLDPEGIGWLTMDQPDRAMNVLNDEAMAPMLRILEQLEQDASLKGLVIASGKKDFIVGADIDMLWAIQTAQGAFERSMQLKRFLRRIELCGKPVVAALNGLCLGGGLELAMACHARILLNDGAARLGLPEVKLGLLPGGGGTQRLPRLVGMQLALQMMGEGSELRADKALASGLVTELADTREALHAQAKAWCLAHPQPKQPWDQARFKYPGGDSRAPSSVQLLAVAPSMASAKSFGNYPALTHIMSSVFEGGLLDIDNAMEVESRYFAACAMSAASRNLIGTLWYQLNAIKKGASRPQSVPVSKVQKIGVLGAGMMGAGIAHASARSGIEVVLLDTTQAAADQGKAHSQSLLDRAVKKGRSTAEQRDAVLARIHPTTRHADLAGCDLVIEAVFEDRAVKAEVTQQAEAVIGADAVFASNTSTLPITSLAQASVRPQNFIGLHFFSPVDQMPLVEIIVGQHTCDTTLARGFDYVLQLGKTPIVVNDSRGFYTSRVFATYVLEGLAMLKEGVHPRSIEAAGLQAGMPVGPLALQDEVSLSLGLHVADQTRRDFAAAGRSYVEHPGESVLRRMCELQRFGKKAGQGFYEHGERTKHLWPGLAAMYPVAPTQPAQQELIDRFMFVQANEAARCYQEKVVRSVADANVGSIFGWGFAPFHGGALQFINAMGAQRFLERATELSQQYGARFEPAAIVQRLAESGRSFNDDDGSR